MNNEFRDVLQQIVNLSYEQKVGLAASSISDLIPELKKLFGDKEVSAIIMAIISTAIAADGQLAPEEYAFAKALFGAAGMEMSDEDLVKTIKIYSTDSGYDIVRNVSKVLPSDVKSKLVTGVAAICAIDNTIDKNEIAFLTTLLFGQ